MSNPVIEDIQSALSACDREPIRIPGSIQQHGFYVAVREENLEIVQVSDNLARFIGCTAEQALGLLLPDLIGADSCAHLQAEMDLHFLDAEAVYLGTINLKEEIFFDALAHRSGGMIVFEFEKTSRQAHADFRHLYPLIGTFLGKLTDIDSIDAMAEVAVQEIKKVTKFGRILLYSFDEQGHGHVLAEARDPEYHSYLNQRFPASDVPRQARELYLTNRIRLIADANYVPSRLVPAEDPLTGQATDLTYSTLRSVSPVHLRYLQNMGTLASMSVSIVVKGKLWGLISCHNATPSIVSFETRNACEQLGQILALRIESKEEASENHARLELRRLLVTMLSVLSQEENFFEGLRGVERELLSFADASGAAIVFDGRLAKFGDTPEDAHIHELVQWISANHTEDVYHTDCLRSEFAAAERMKEKASGILALSISRVHRHYLIWFRPEVIQTIDWAGNPHLKSHAGDGAGELSPRKSFDIWRETVVGRSLPWSASALEIAVEFRTALLGIVLERAEQMAELAEELGRANKELEAFSYSVSHDLRAPMRHIVGFADLLLEFEGERLSERSGRFLKNIKESARFAGKLVDDLLSFSQMGRAALRLTEVDMNDLVNASIDKLTNESGERTVYWNLGDLPLVNGDPAFLQPAIYNLLSNAVKYTKTRPEAVIDVWSESDGDAFVFHVRDNGVGFNMDYVHKLFGVFQRLHRMEEFEGTGIGLANVRRIVERHGGRVWAEGVPERGATFSFSIPKEIHLEEGNHHVKTHPSR